MSDQAQDFGQRADGSQKGMGFLGAIKNPSGDVMTEFSVGVNLDGKDVEIPSLVPTLSPDEVRAIVESGQVPDSAVEKAVAHARARLAAGKSPFAEAGESPEKPMYDFGFDAQREFEAGYHGQ
jgi:hypothetical protein